MKNITAATLADQLANHPTIIDVREDFEFATGHVPGAKNIPLSELAERYPEVPDGAYIICQTGGRSAGAAEFLQAHGTAVINVAGGTSAWPKPLEV
ncbi:rhodanese-like domain-containing protein [Lacticaseibacillus jixianensis]|uniref:Rhodanese-like domain-containing protein n=1 Tax=Lacticaseibacillus jixianensis TaxID=2486012 RepID=A0ABW4B9W7_9LACO|nr:rhodanese-like domain-containing protein [Lacticaseibacillus jixianensis]